MTVARVNVTSSRPSGPGRSNVRALSRYAAPAGVVLLVVVTHASLLLGYASPIWDALEFYGPYQMLIGDYVRNGRLLLWNPFTSFGSPDAIEPQVGAFSPVIVLFGLAFGGSRRGFEIYWLFVWLLGPLGVLRLARHLRTPAWGAYSVATAWALSGFYTGHAEHTDFIASVSSLPWILWRLDVSVRDQRTWPAIEAGALWGLSALAGYPGLIFLNACFAAVWTLGRSGRPLYIVKTLAAMAATGLLVLSPTYVSFLIEGRGYSHRAGALPFDVAVESNALHPLALITLTSPGLALANVYEYTDIALRSLYVGTVIPVLAAIALTARRSRFRWLLLAAGLLFVAGALGHSLPMRGWLYDWILPTRYFRHAAMFRVYLMVALAVLALFGAADIESMLNAGDRRLRPVFTVGAITAVVALAAYLAAAAMVPALSNTGLVQSLQPIAGWGLLFGLCLMAALAFNRARSALPMTLVTIATLDAMASAYVMRPVMYGPATWQWQDLDTWRVADVAVTARGLERVARNWGNFTFAPKVPAASGYSALTGPLVREYVSEPVLLDAAVGTDRLWFSPTGAEVERSSACLAAFRDAAARLGAPPLVIHRRDVMEVQTGDARGNCRTPIRDLPAAKRLRGAAVHVDIYTPERLRMAVHVDEPGWLLVTDSWSRGWTAIVNGQPAEVAGGNFLFRAVRVGPGTNTIDFRYRPFGYPWLLVVSWSTLVGVLVVTLRRRRRSAQSGAEPVSAGAIEAGGAHGDT
jgi:hypothetical protein